MNKDTLTNYCSLVILVAGAIIGVQATGAIILPTIIITISTVAAAVAGAIVAWTTGKPADLKPIDKGDGR